MDKKAKSAMFLALSLVAVLLTSLVFAAKPQCKDGKDNDGDGLIDYPADPGCSSRNDNSEFNQPTTTTTIPGNQTTTTSSTSTTIMGNLTA